MKRLLILVLAIAAAAAVPIAGAQNRLEIPAPTVGRTDTSEIRVAPTYVDARVLAANTQETHSVPAGAKFVMFSADCTFFAKPGASAAVPAADVTDGTASEQNPAAWYLTGVTQITLIAATTCKITLSFYL